MLEAVANRVVSDIECEGFGGREGEKKGRFLVPGRSSGTPG